MRLRAWVVCAGIVSAAVPTQAQQQRPTVPITTPKPLSQTLTGDAKAAYEAGKLLFGDGDYTGAEIKFKAAFDSSGDARLLWNMAACEKSQRHYARTDQLVRDYVDKGGTLLTDQDRADAKALLDLIDSFTVKLTITVNEPDAEVTVDDVSVGKTPLSKPIVVDIGARKVVVQKPNFKESAQTITVGGSATAKLDVNLEVQLHEGRVSIISQPDAEIYLDQQRVGHGRYNGSVKSGGHTLRVVAPGMRVYQTEMTISDDEARTIDVPLEHEVEAVTVKKAKPKGPWSPGGEIALSTGPGVKMRNGGAAVYDVRAEIGWRQGWFTQLGLTFDLGTIDASNNCATDFHGPTPISATDVDIRFSVQSCTFIKPGLQFAVHFIPKGRFDLYASLELGFMLTFVQFKYYDPLGGPPPTSANIIIGGDLGGRLGLDYRPIATNNRWRVGAFASGLYVTDQEKPDNNGCNSCGGGITPPSPSNNGKNGPAQYPWLIFGIRTSLIF